MSNSEYGYEPTSFDDANRSERLPSAIEQQVLAVRSDSLLDEVCEALCASDWLLSRAKAINVLMAQRVINWIDEHGPFSIGDVQHTVGFTATTKCQDVVQTGHRILEAVSGDVDEFLATLCSQPFKSATVKALIEPRVYGSLFRYVRTGKLIRGEPPRILKRVDQRFVTPRTSS